MRKVAGHALPAIILAAVLSILFTACKVGVGDDSDPSPISGFRYVCDAALEIDVCVIPDTRSLRWVAGGDDGSKGRAFQYDIRYSTSFISEANFNQANQLVDEPFPLQAGSLETIMLPRIDPFERFYFAIRTLDEIGNKSPVVSTGNSFPTPFLRVPIRTVEAVAADIANPIGFGASLANIGNMDGSPREDFAIGAPGADSPTNTSTGAIYIVYNSNGLEYVDSTNGFIHARDYRTESAVIYGEATGDGFGTSVVGMFDFNGDRLGDIAVSAPDAASGAGRVYIFFGGNNALSIGSITDLSLSQADVTIQGPTGSAGSFGKTIASGGLLNSIAGDELVVGSPDENAGAGAVYVFYGGLQASHAVNDTSGTPIFIDLDIATPEVKILGRAGANLGAALPPNNASLNGDRYEDLVIGAPGEGAVHVFYGSYGQSNIVLDFLVTGGITYDMDMIANVADLEIVGPSLFGASISVRGDVNRDGVADLAVGAPGIARVYVFFGASDDGVINFAATRTYIMASIRPADATFVGLAGSNFGQEVDITGDMNGDGFFDVLVGAPSTGSGNGRVYGFLGSPDRSAFVEDVQWFDAYINLSPVASGPGFGTRIITLGDMVVDQALTHYRHEDILVSSPMGSTPSVFMEF